MTSPIERARDIAYGKLTRCPNVCRPDLAITAFVAALAEEGLCIVPRGELLADLEMLRKAILAGDSANELKFRVDDIAAALNSKEKE